MDGYQAKSSNSQLQQVTSRFCGHAHFDRMTALDMGQCAELAKVTSSP